MQGYAPQDALSRLLAGTGLQARYSSATAFTLVEPAARPSGPDGDRPATVPLAYAGVLQRTVTRALCQWRGAEFGRYRAALQLWIGRNGVVAAPLAGTGDARRDAADWPDDRPGDGRAAARRAAAAGAHPPGAARRRGRGLPARGWRLIPVSAPSASLRELFLAKYQDFRKRLRIRLGSEDLANEAMQETWLRVESMPDAAPVEYPAAYLFKIAVNVAEDQRRGSARLLSMEELEELYELADEAAGPVREVEGASSWRRWRRRWRNCRAGARPS